MKNFYLIVCFLIGITSCDAILSKEIARIPVNELSTQDNLNIKSTTLDLKKGEKIFFWSDIDIEYVGMLNLNFQIQMSANDIYKGGFEFDPREKDISIGELKTTINDKTNWRFVGKNKSAVIEEDGFYTFEVLLSSSKNNNLIINKAELIIKK